MYEQSLISIRDFFVKNFLVKIIGLKKNTNITWIETNGFFSKIIGFILMLIPLAITIKVSNFFSYDVIYNYDNIYYISNTSSNKITPVLLEFKAYRNNSNCNCNSNSTNEPEYFYDLTYQIKYYNSSIPFNVFATLNIPKIYDSIKLKYIMKGTIKEKHLIINDIKNYLIYNLFEN